MISDGSCDTEDCNECWKLSFAITGINYILQYTKADFFQFILIYFYLFFELF